MNIKEECPVINIEDIKAAYERIKPYIRHTPLLDAYNMKSELGCEAYMKPEMLQYVGAFKLRGALNAILSMDESKRKHGIITSSSGNHAQACAYAGQLLNIPVTVVIPEDAPAIKINNAKAMGANVILWERDYYSRLDKVKSEAAKHGYEIVHPYEDPRVMAGQGTIAIEILNDLPDVNKILVPIGGGGLISGIAAASKALKPDIKIIGVQPSASPAYFNSRKEGHRVSVDPLPTVADGLACRQAGDNPYIMIEKYVDDIITVDDEQIVDAVRLIANKAKLIAEPSSCVGPAALLYKKLSVRPDEKVVCVLTAGNWSIEDIAHLYIGDEIRRIH